MYQIKSFEVKNVVNENTTYLKTVLSSGAKVDICHTTLGDDVVPYELDIYIKRPKKLVFEHALVWTSRGRICPENPHIMWRYLSAISSELSRKSFVDDNGIETLYYSGLALSVPEPERTFIVGIHDLLRRNRMYIHTMSFERACADHHNNGYPILSQCKKRINVV